MNQDLFEIAEEIGLLPSKEKLVVSENNDAIIHYKVHNDKLKVITSFDGGFAMTMIEEYDLSKQEQIECLLTA